MCDKFTDVPQSNGIYVDISVHFFPFSNSLLSPNNYFSVRRKKKLFVSTKLTDPSFLC